MCCKLVQQSISSHTCGHGIEASYITVHSYDTLAINTHPQTCVIAKVLLRYYCDIAITHITSIGQY